MSFDLHRLLHAKLVEPKLKIFFCQQTVDVTAQSKTHQKYFMQHFEQRIRQKSGRCHLNGIGKGDGFKSKVY